MPATRLPTIRVEKPWGRHDLWPGFENPDAGGDPVGEIWFDAPGDPELLVKYLFTSERLSIQVHPNDAEARAAGYARGKDEAWLILAAEPDARIALGTLRPVTHDELRAACRDGSVVDLMDWKRVSAGEIVYSAANTVHAIGAGITLIEVQQNVDCTYRLYDYGRPRELHLDEGVAVSRAVPFVAPPKTAWKFDLRRFAPGKVTLLAFEGAPGWIVPVTGAGALGGEAAKAGECWIAQGNVAVSGDLDLLVASPKPFETSV
jgi:mannose-6-phosphate isomerase